MLVDGVAKEVLPHHRAEALRLGRYALCTSCDVMMY